MVYTPRLHYSRQGKLRRSARRVTMTNRGGDRYPGTMRLYAKRPFTGIRRFKGKIKPINNEIVSRTFTLTRECVLTSGISPSGDIFLSEASWATFLPLRGAMGFTLADIPDDIRNPMEDLYQEVRLDWIKIKFYPYSVAGAINNAQDQVTPAGQFYTYLVRKPHVFAKDFQDANLETTTELLQSASVKKYSPNQNRPYKDWLRPRSRAPLVSQPNELQGVKSVTSSFWMSTNDDLYEEVAMWGFKWSTEDAVIRNGDVDTFKSGQFEFTYKVSWRYPKAVAMNNGGP